MREIKQVSAANGAGNGRRSRILLRELRNSKLNLMEQIEHEEESQPHTNGLRDRVREKERNNIYFTH